MHWRLVVAVVHTAEWRCVGPVATAPRSVVEWYIFQRVVSFLARSFCN
jgi:hypothetical protein